MRRAVVALPATPVVATPAAVTRVARASRAVVTRSRPAGPPALAPWGVAGKAVHTTRVPATTVAWFVPMAPMAADTAHRPGSCGSARACARQGSSVRRTHRRTGSQARFRCRTSGNASRHQRNKARLSTPHITPESSAPGPHGGAAARVRTICWRPRTRGRMAASGVAEPVRIRRHGCVTLDARE